MRARAVILACAIVTGTLGLRSSDARAADEEPDTTTAPAETPPAPSSPTTTPTPTPASTSASTSATPVADKPIVVWPTLTPAGDEVSGAPLHKPAPAEGTIHARAMELDATLRDAVLVHSGASLGLGLGALTDYFHRGDLNKTPYTGAGYGSALGLIAGGTLSKLTKVPASRILLVDLGAGLGAAAGAAIGSPLVFEQVTPEKTRGFVAATFGGTLIGGAAAWWFTRDRTSAPARPPSSPAAFRISPYGGTIGASQTRDGVVPAYGAGVHGTW